MNTIGINNNLDRARIRKLLIIGLIGSVMTGIGDFLVGYGASLVTGGLLATLPDETAFQKFRSSISTKAQEGAR